MLLTLAALRGAGLSADADYAGRSFKGQMTQAGRSRARTVAIVRGEEATIRQGKEAEQRSRSAISSLRSPSMSWRDIHCGELRPEHVGRRIKVAGWVDTRRDHGGLVFVDLRDHTGKVQLVLKETETAHELRNEFVVQVEGEVVARAPEAVNPNLATGAVEIQVDELRILARSTPLPFQLDEENVDENLRLRYRWLDMRRERMQHNLRVAHAAIAGMRRTMDALGFVDVWTPAMTRGTPEGARDFLTPVRLQPGKFFALAQSPQLFKQLCMIGGIDRYYQIATCWRDEDLRADRQFEFRQLDLELAFVEADDVLEVMESAVCGAFEAVGREPPARPFQRLDYDDVMLRYGSDKPDRRFGLEIQDATEVTRGSEFGVFAKAPCVRYLVVPQALSRSEHARLEALAKEWGAKGLATLPALAGLEVPLRARARGVRDPGGLDGALRRGHRAGRRKGARPAAPASRARARPDRPRGAGLPLGARLPALRAGRGFGRLDVHAPRLHGAGARPRGVGRGGPGRRARTALRPDLERLGARLGLDPDPCVATQEKVFRTMGLSEEEAHSKFGFLLEALAMGAPPHGGFAMGIERFVAQLAGEADIRQVVAFPKVSSGSDPLTGAPTAMPEDVLRELGIAALPQDNSPAR